MYINFWYPICTSEELSTEAPKVVELLGVRLATFRDSTGAAQVISDTCIHRGGSLSQGKIEGDSVTCAYHGWSFDGSGKCTKIPQIKDGKIPGRAKVDAYPVHEAYGVVFAFLGDAPESERPPVPIVEEWDQEGWRCTGPIVFEIDAYYERSVENGMDPLHNEFVHPNQGAPALDQNDIELKDQEWGAWFDAKFGAYTQAENRKKIADSDDSAKDLHAGSWHIGPNHLMTGIHLMNKISFIQYFFEAPISKDRTRIFFLNSRNTTLEESADEYINKTLMGIAIEDKNVIEHLRPRNTPDTLTKELLLPGDESVVRYRQYLKTWEEKGWRIDMHALGKNNEDSALAIPSPGRRESKSWVLDTVPLVPAKS